MPQLRLAWSKPAPPPSPFSLPKLTPLKSALSPPSSERKQPSLTAKLITLQARRPIAAAAVERLVDKLLEST